MKVKDRTKSDTEYKGRWIEGADKGCPCRTCFNPHDCGYFSGGKWQIRMECLTRYSKGCPSPMPFAVHILKYIKPEKRRNGMERKCLRCNQIIILGLDRWKMNADEEER